MKIRIYITLKNGVLDPQGKAVEHSLHALGFVEAQEVRVGKLIEFECAGSRSEAAARARVMCDQLLANPVIEQYRIEIV